MKIKGTSSGRKIRGYTSADLDFTIISTPIDVVYEASNLQITHNDVIYNMSFASGTDHLVQVTYEYSTQKFPDGLTLNLLTPIIGMNYSGSDSSYMGLIKVANIIVDNQGNIDFAYDPEFGLNPNVYDAPVSEILERFPIGKAYFSVSGYHLTKIIAVPLSKTGHSYNSEFVDYIPGSLAKHCSDKINDAIAGKTAEQANASVALFTDLPFSETNPSETYVRNPNFWLPSFLQKLTCVSPWNSNYGVYKTGTLVSPRHILLAEHFDYPVGTTVRFINTAGDVFHYSVTAVRSVGPSDVTDNYQSDISIACLNEDVDSSISFCKILPADWANYLPSIYGTTTYPYLMVPAISLHSTSIDSEGSKAIKTVTINGLLTLLPLPYIIGESRTVMYKPNDSQQNLFFARLQLGSSGSPSFLLVNNDLVLITTWTSTSVIGVSPEGIGPNITDLSTLINEEMLAQGGGYTLTPIDLSEFPLFDPFNQ